MNQSLISFPLAPEVSMQYFLRRFRAVQFIAVAIAVFAIACGAESERSTLMTADEGGTVEADAGHVKIVVPPGGLAEDLEITVSKAENSVEESGDMPELAAYEFAPDGTVHKEAHGLLADEITEVSVGH